jgi:O-antigen/teichoic acid export membrane protein
MTMKLKVLTALRWIAVARFAGQICSWAITIYVIRILSPDDYGLIAMASVLIGLATLANELGFIPALIQAKNVSDYLVRQVFGVVLVSNALVFLGVLMAAPYLAMFFEEDRLTPIAQVLAVTLLISALSAVPSAMLQRDILFKRISVAEFSATIVSGLATLTLAILGFGVWSLVIGNLVRVTTMTIGILIAGQFWMSPVLRLDGLGRLFSFGAKITVQKVLWYANTHLDLALVGKLLGNHALGLYSVVFHLANLPMSKIMAVINQVAFPLYSRLQNDVEQASAYYFKSVQLASLLFFPLMWGFSSVAPEFVDVILGDKWAGASVILQVLTLVVPFRVLAVLLSPLVNGLGRPGLGTRNLLTYTVLMTPAIAVGTQWGLIGVCVGLVGAQMVAWIINFRRSLAVVDRTVNQLLVILAPSVASAAVMYAVVMAAKTFVLADTSAIWRLPILIVTGVAVYAVMTLTINRDSALRSLALLRQRT